MRTFLLNYSAKFYMFLAIIVIVAAISMLYLASLLWSELYRPIPIKEVCNQYRDDDDDFVVIYTDRACIDGPDIDIIEAHQIVRRHLRIKQADQIIPVDENHRGFIGFGLGLNG